MGCYSHGVLYVWVLWGVIGVGAMDVSAMGVRELTFRRVIFIAVR